jgi:hypothetical protein
MCYKAYPWFIKDYQALWSGIPNHPAKNINLSRKLLTYGLDNEDANIRSEYNLIFY